MSGETPVANSPTTECINALVDNSTGVHIEYPFAVNAENVRCTDGSNNITLSDYLAYLQEYANQGVRIDTKFKPMPIDSSPSV